MKRIMRYTLAVLASLQVFAANAQGQSMLDGNPVWMYMQWYEASSQLFMDESPGKYYIGVNHVYYIDGDTVVNGISYKKLYHVISSSTSNEFSSTFTKEVLPVREVGSRLLAPRSVYQQKWGEESWYYEAYDQLQDEVVLYDFDVLTHEHEMSVFKNGTAERHEISQSGTVTLTDGTILPTYLVQGTDTSCTILPYIGLNEGAPFMYAPFNYDSYFTADTIKHIYEGPLPYTYHLYEHDSDGNIVQTIIVNKRSSRLLAFVRNNEVVYNITNEEIPFDISEYMHFDITEGEDGFVDLGLSVKWATCNLGASSPTDKGLYYFWGDTVGINADKEFEISNNSYFDYNDKLLNHIAKTKYDAAYKTNPVSRMPTAAEYRELTDLCKKNRVIINGVTGELYTGPNGNTLFLPMCGHIKCIHDKTSLSNTLSEEKSLEAYLTDELSHNGAVAFDIFSNTIVSINNNITPSSVAASLFQVRPVYDPLGDKWLSTAEYINYVNEYPLWGEYSDVNPTADAWNDLLNRYGELFNTSDSELDRLQQLLLKYYEKYVATKDINYFAAIACRTYTGSDNRTIYFIDHIDDEFIDFLHGGTESYVLSDLVNVDIDYKGNPLYTKTCEWTMESCADSLGLPDNTYLYATPISTSAQPYIAFNMPNTLLMGYNHTLRITMAPETHEGVTPQPNQFRGNIFFTDKNGSWPINRNMTLRNPVDNAPNFVSSATEVTVFDIPIDVNYMTDIMVQIQSYVSASQTKNYSRSLRIANVEIISTPIDVDYALLTNMTQVGEEVISGLCDYTDGLQVKLDMQRIGHLFGNDFDTESLKLYAMSSTSTSTLMSRNADDASHDFMLDMECVVNNRHTVNTDIFAVAYAVTDGTLSISADEQTCHPGVRSAGSLFLVDESSQRYYELVLDVQFAQKQTLLASFDVVKTIKLNVELMTTNSYYTHYDASKKFYSLVVSDIDLDLVTETLGTSNPMLYAEQKTDGHSMLTCDYTAAPAQGFWFKAGDDGVSYVNQFDNTCCVGMYFIDGQLRWYEIPRRPQPGDTYTLNLYLTNPQSSKAVKYVVTITYCDKFSGNVASHAVRRLPVGMTAGDDATDIMSLVNGKSVNGKSIYNLNGQRLNAPQRGLNIVGGRKVLVK